MSGVRYQLKLFLFFTLLFLAPLSIFSQMVATFSANTTSGCSPLAVDFTPDYTIAQSYYWNFGNGNVSDSMIAFATYTIPGVYTVQLNVSDGVSTVSETMEITVFIDPVAGFTFSGQTNNGCQPSTATFTDLSFQGDAPIVNWFWDFGDGYTSLELNSSPPSHNYAFHGDYSVSLEVTDANGCSDVLLLNNIVHVSELPVISFYGDITQFCIPPGEVSFTNMSTGYGSLNSVWDFGDGQSSVFNNPIHTFADYGYYDISLTVTDANGCISSSTLIDYIKIDTVRADFNIPDTICAQDTLFPENISSGATVYSWDWMVGTSTSPSPLISIAQGGYFTITLDASLNGMCNDIHSDTIFVESVLAIYQPSQYYVCEIPTNVTYLNQSMTNNSQGFDSIYWDFELYYPMAYQTPTSDFSPVIIYDGDTTLFMSENHWVYHSFLEVTTPFGCVDSLKDSIMVWVPAPRMSIDQNTSCVPCIVDLEDISLYLSPYDSIISWEWDFGSQSPPYFGQFPPQQTYLDSGLFEISMTITTAEGCVHTAVTTISCGYQQNASFIMISPDTICGTDFIEFISTSTDTALIHSYYWTFSDGEHAGGQHITEIPMVLGWSDMSLSVSHYGCDDIYTVQDAFYVLGPIGYPHVTHNCENTFLYNFSPSYIDPFNGFLGVDHFYWDFSDGSPIDSVNEYTTHLYTTAPIDTFIYLTLVNDESGCIRRDSIMIHVRDPIAEFVMDTTKICPGDTVTFDPSLSLDYDVFAYAWGYVRNFLWNFDDGTEFGTLDPLILMDDTITTGPIEHVFEEPGYYNVRLIIKDMHGCPDTVYHEVHVFNVTPIPFADPPGGCTPISCIFTDNSISDTTIVSWFWNFGQGDFSMSQNPADTIYYLVDSSYSVTLSVIDILGCSNVSVIEVVASTPVAEFYINTSLICLGDVVSFADSSTTYASSPQYTWNFGDGNTSSDQNPEHIYQQAGFYTVFLDIIDGTCSTSDTLAVQIEVQDPYCEIFSTVSNTVCIPEHVIFHAEPHPSYFQQVLWDLGDGTPSYATEPGHNYTTPGTYPVSLRVTTTANCQFFSDTLYLDVVYVSANLEFSDYEICLGESIDLIVQNAINVDSVRIDFGDGSPPGSDMIVNHTYNVVSPDGFLIPSLIYWSVDSGCEQSDEDTLFIKDVRAYFNRGPNDTDTASCYSLSVLFEHEAIGADLFLWDFGDGSTSSQEYPPVHTFNAPGDYFVVLTVYGDDCYVDEGKWVHVYPAPDIQVNTDNEICFGDNIQLNADGGIIYLWMPDSFLSNNEIYNPVANPPYSYDYILEVTDERGCVNQKTVPVFVQQTPEINLIDTSLIVGDIFNLPDSSLYNVEYQWSPVYGLFYSNVYNPGFQPMESTTYTVTMYAYADGVLCDTASANFYIDVLWQFSVDIPQVFTPNGDGVNDLVYVRGWGIKNLIDFRIYNRWGELVFQTDDILIGWNGIYKGQLQVSDTYVYDVEIETYENKRLKKKGSISLMR